MEHIDSGSEAAAIDLTSTATATDYRRKILPVVFPERIAVVAGLRTPFGRQLTFYKGINVIELGKIVVSELMARSDIDPKLIDRVAFGQVLALPEAPNIAREIVLGTNMDVHTDGVAMSRACATGFQTAVSITEAIIAGDIDIGIAGGADSSSVVPIQFSRRFADTMVEMPKAKSLGQKLALLRRLSLRDLVPVPPAVKEYSTGLRMGDTAEQMARDHGISRAAQDALAHRSHMLAAQAWNAGKLDAEVMTVHLPPFKDAIKRDNNIRFDSVLENYSKLKPAFDREHGTVTPANATPLTDGAAALMIMRESRAKELGLEVLGFIRSYAFSALEADIDMLMGPSYASPRALDKAGVTLKDLSLIDMHEAFAAQTLANVKMFASETFAREKLGRASAIGEIDMDKFNVNGSSIAYGHPFAATGPRMITQNLYELRRRGGGLALTTACAAGGIGAAMVVEVC